MQRTTRRRPAPTPCHFGWWTLFRIALGCGLCVSACAGGSGSSGFDARAENNAIDQALGTHECEVSNGLTICASGGTTPTPADTATPPLPTRTATPTPTSSQSPSRVPTPTATPPMFPPTATPTLAGTPLGSPTTTTTLPHLTVTPTTALSASPNQTPTPTTPPAPPTSTASVTATATPANTASFTPTAPFTPTATPAQPSITTNLDSSDTIPCQQAGPRQPCIFVLTFEPHAAPADAAYRVAVRTRSPDSPWLISPVTDNSASIAVNPTPAGRRYQIAVLLFLQDPGFVPDRVNLLADTGADFAFVTPLLTPEPLAASRRPLPSDDP